MLEDGRCLIPVRRRVEHRYILPLTLSARRCRPLYCFPLHSMIYPNTYSLPNNLTMGLARKKTPSDVLRLHAALLPHTEPPAVTGSLVRAAIVVIMCSSDPFRTDKFRRWLLLPSSNLHHHVLFTTPNTRGTLVVTASQPVSCLPRFGTHIFSIISSNPCRHHARPQRVQAGRACLQPHYRRQGWCSQGHQYLHQGVRRSARG